MDIQTQAFVREVGARIAEARRARGWTQARLADALGIEATTLSRLETGKRPLSLPLIAKVAHHLQVSPASLVDVHATLEGPRPDEEIVILWRSLIPEHQRVVLEVARALAGVAGP